MIPTPNEVLLSNTSIGESDPNKLHLLRRTIYAITPKNIASVATLNMTALVDRLIGKSTNPPALPLKDYNFVYAGHVDSDVMPMQSWVNDHTFNPDVARKRKSSLAKWFTGQLLRDELSIHPKMLMFWNNFFSLELQKISYPQLAYNHYCQIYAHGLENFRDLLVQVLLQRAMSQVTKKNKTSSETTNEALCHLILSQFTVGKSYLSVVSKEKRKKLYRLLNKWDLLTDTLMLHSKHNQRINTFELERFTDKSSVKELTAELYLFFTGLLMYEPVSLNIATRFFQWFVHPEADSQSMSRIIEPAAAEFLNNGFEIRPLIRSVLLSEHFYDERFFGVMVKSPVDFIAGIFHLLPTEIINERDACRQYNIWHWALESMKSLGQDPCNPPGQAGWPQYQEFPFGNSWLSPDASALRLQIGEKICSRGYQIDKNLTLKIDATRLAKVNGEDLDPEQLLRRLLLTLSSSGVSEKVVTGMRDFFVYDRMTGATTPQFVDRTEHDHSAGLEEKQELFKDPENLIAFILNLPGFQNF